MLETRTKTTSLTEIREFLSRGGCAPTPWSSADAAVEHLYEVLRRQRGEESFWCDLRDLTNRLEDRRFRPSKLGGSGTLGPAVTESLLAELRASLPPVNGSPHPFGGWLRSKVSAGALAGFLLLGTAAACSDGDGLCRDDAESHGLMGEEATVYNALVGIVNESSLTLDERCTIYECLPDLDATYREGLLQEWQTLDEDEISWRIDTLLSLCEVEEDDDDWDDCDDGCH